MGLIRTSPFKNNCLIHHRSISYTEHTTPTGRNHIEKSSKCCYLDGLVSKPWNIARDVLHRSSAHQQYEIKMAEGSEMASWNVCQSRA